MSPAIAVLGPPRREREDVIGGVANGAQDRAFDREKLFKPNPGAAPAPFSLTSPYGA